MSKQEYIPYESIGYLTGRVKREITRLLARKLYEAGGEITAEQFRLLMMLWIEQFEARPEVQAVDIIKVRLGAMKPTQEQLKLVFGDYIAKAEIMAGKRQLTGDVIMGLMTVFGLNSKVLFGKIENNES